MPIRRTGAVLAAALLAGVCGVPAAAATPPRYVPYYSVFTTSPRDLPYLDTTYVPQGIAYWPERDWLVISYYDDKGGRARLAFLDRATYQLRKSVYLDAAIHAATLTMSKNNLWVSATSDTSTPKTQVLRYAKSALNATADGGQVADNGRFPLKASSVMEIEGSALYVGTFGDTAPATIYRYQLNAAEQPAAEPDEHFGAPQHVQGMTITADNFLYTTTTDRQADSHLVVDPRHGAITNTWVAPNMAEDLALVGGEVYVIYESGAKKFDGADAPDYREPTVDHGPAARLNPAG